MAEQTVVLLPPAKTAVAPSYPLGTHLACFAGAVEVELAVDDQGAPSALIVRSSVTAVAPLLT